MPPKLTAVCLITDDVARLRAFYEVVLQVTGEGDDQFAYFRTETFLLSVYSTSGMESMAPGSTLGAGTGKWVLEAEVEDVDAEAARLTALGVPIVKPPANYEWGQRSVWFRDPDGNVVDFHAPVRA